MRVLYLLGIAAAFVLVTGPAVAANRRAIVGPPAAAAPAVAPGDWTQFRLNARNDAGVRGSSNLEVSWSIKTGGGFSASPTIHDGKLFIGNNIGQFFAVNLRSGAIDWSRKYPAPLMAAPIVYHNTVFLGEGDQAPSRRMFMRGSHVGAGANALIAVDATTGVPKWAVPLDGSGMPTSAVIDGLLIQHDGSGVVRAVDPDTGVVRYARQLDGMASMSAVLPVGNGRFFTNGTVRNAAWEMNAGNGTIVWEHLFDPNAQGIGDCPAATDGKRIFCDYVGPTDGLKGVDVGNPGRMHAYALSVDKGTTVWDTMLEAGNVPKWNEAAIPLVAHGTVYIGNSLAPYMHAIDASSGRVLWATRVRGPVKSGAVRDGNVVYFGDLGGYLWALDSRTGHVIGVKNMHAPFNVGSPVIVGRTLFIGAKNGEVIAVPLAQIRQSHDR